MTRSENYYPTLSKNNSVKWAAFYFLASEHQAVESRAANMAVDNKRLRIMEEMDQRMEELEEFDDDVTDYKDTLEETDLIEDDENYLFNLERYRRHLEKEGLKGTIWEPSLIVCWTIVFVVTMYVIFLIIAGDSDNQIIKDELWGVNVKIEV